MTSAMQGRETTLAEIRTAIRHMAVYGMGNILAKALGFFMLPFYTHYLNPAAYGILEILDLSMSLFALILSMGLTPAFLRCYAAAESSEEKRKVVSTGCIFGVLTGLITFFLGLGLIRPVSNLLFGPSVPALYVLLSFTSIILNYMANLPRTYLRAMEASGTYTLVDLAQVLFLLCFNIVFIAVFKMGLEGVLWSSFVVGSVQFSAMTLWAFYEAGIRFDLPHLQRMLGFGTPLIVSNLGLFVLNFSDRFFLQHLRSLELVGIYAVGYKFGYMMNFLFVQPFFVMWQSRMYAIHTKPEHGLIFRQVFSLYWYGLICAGLAMSLFSSEVVHIMVEPKFAASENVIPLVVLSYVFYGLSYYAQLGMFLTDKTKTIGVIGAITAVLNLGLNCILILHFGMMGAAWATVLSFAFMASVSYWQSQRVFRLPLSIGRMFVAMILAAGLYLFMHRWNQPSLGIVVPAKLIALSFFAIFVWKSRILPSAAAAVLHSATAYATSMASARFAGWSRPELNEGDRL